MGELSDVAKRNSKFFYIDIGETVECVFVNYRIVPNAKDPSKEAIMYQLRVDGQDKFWTNSSGRVMRAMDNIQKGSLIYVKREQMRDDATGKVVEGKSTYSVMPVEAEGIKAQPGINPGDVVTPEDIPWDAEK